MRKRTVEKSVSRVVLVANCFRTDLRGKRMVRRMKADERRMMEGEDEVRTKHWKEFGRKREDTEAEMGDGVRK